MFDIDWGDALVLQDDPVNTRVNQLSAMRMVETMNPIACGPKTITYPIYYYTDFSNN